MVQGGGDGSETVECGNPAFPCHKFGLEEGSQAVGAIDLGAGLLACGDPAGTGAFESMKRIEKGVVGCIFPRDVREG